MVSSLFHEISGNGEIHADVTTGCLLTSPRRRLADGHNKLFNRLRDLERNPQIIR